ncbi:protein rolling stone-like [Sycon ciliatum]|uniref:protein rolling stone-like n=1 Tax=Sycon ciliatum TaxID=27933 RepID=UPI0020ACC7F6|eukprot:scpid49406/ scgid12968/ Protein rolling stone
MSQGTPPRNPDFPFREEFARTKFFATQENAAWLSSSPFIPDIALLVVNFVFAAFSVAIIIWSGSNEGSAKWFIFLTNWGYLMVVLSFVGFVIVGVFQLWRRRSLLLQGKVDEELRQGLAVWNWLHALQQVIFSIGLASSILITILYYALLSPRGGFLDVSVHALNTVLTVIAICLTNFKVNVLHFIYPLVFGVAYLIFSVIYTLSGGTNTQNRTYIYSPLDWNSKPGGAAALSLPAVLIGIPVVHLICYGIMKLRVAIARHACNKVAPSGGDGIAMRHV